MKLAASLKKTLCELRALMTSDELPLWAAFHQLEGLPETRMEAATALAGTATANSLGAKISPKDLIPDFTPTVIDNKKGFELFKAWANAQVKTAQRGAGKDT